MRAVHCEPRAIDSIEIVGEHLNCNLNCASLVPRELWRLRFPNGEFGEETDMLSCEHGTAMRMLQASRPAGDRTQRCESYIVRAHIVGGIHERERLDEMLWPA